MAFADSVALYAVGYINKERHPHRLAQCCVNTKQRLTPCTQCVDVCPSHIDILSEAPDWLSCVSCNRCVVACPSNALEPCALDIDIIKNAQRLSGDGLSIACTRYKGSADIVVECISRFTWEQIASLALLKTVALKLSPCKTCDRADDVCNVHSLYNKLRKFMGAKEFSKRIVPKLGENIIPPSTYDRQQLRTILSSYKRGASALLDTREHADDTIKEADTVKLPTTFDSGNLESILSSQRELLINTLLYCNQLNHRVSVTWDTFSFTDDCTGCSICTKMCPSHALEIVSEDDTYMLVHNASACSGCGLCYLSCPQEAIGESVPYESCIVPAYNRHAIQVVRCEKCGRLFKPSQEETRCPTCSRLRFSPY